MFSNHQKRKVNHNNYNNGTSHTNNNNYKGRRSNGVRLSSIPVEKIFDDLDEWLDYCRFNMIRFDEADLYSSNEYKSFKYWQSRNNNS